MRSTSAPSNVKLLGLFNFFNDFRLFGPVLVVYYQHVAGSYLLAAAVFAIVMVSSAVVEIPTGLLSDRLRRTRVTAVGGAFTVFAIATYAIAQSFAVLVTGALLEGIGRALFSGNNDALLWDSLKVHGRESEFHHWSGRVNAGFQIALATSAALGGVVALWSIRATVALSVVPQVASVGVALLMVEPVRQRHVEPEHPWRQLVTACKYLARHRQLRRLTFATAVGYGAGEGGWQLQPAFVSSLWPSWAVGLGRAANHAFSIVGFWWASKIIDRFGAARSNLVGSLFAGALGLVAFVKPTMVSPAITPLEGLAFGSGSTAQGLMMQEMFTDRERATLSSIGQFAGSLIFGAFLLGGGVLADAYSPRVALIVCQVGALLIVPLYWKTYRERASSNGRSKG